MAEREPKLGSKGYCKNCGYRIEVMEISTGKMFGDPFWKLEWRHIYGATGRDAGRHCFNAPVAQPRSHKKKVEAPVMTDKTPEELDPFPYEIRDKGILVGREPGDLDPRASFKPRLQYVQDPARYNLGDGTAPPEENFWDDRTDPGAYCQTDSERDLDMRHKIARLGAATALRAVSWEGIVQTSSPAMVRDLMRAAADEYEAGKRTV